MSDDRADQVRRLAQAMAVRGVSFQFYEHLASAQYDAGARIPDPPAWVMPVVSRAAVTAYENASHLSGSKHAIVAGLRAAWPHLLRDSVAALPKNWDGSLSTGGSYCLHPVWQEHFLAALGAAPDGA